MAQFPALPLWTDALIADTTHLTRAEFGAYLLLLCAAWRRPNCDLPDDDRVLSAIARCDRKTWPALRQVLSQFHTIKDGLWVQKRLQKERSFVAEKGRKNAANARARWSGQTGNFPTLLTETFPGIAQPNPLASNELAYANAMPETCERNAPTPTPIKENVIPPSSKPLTPRTNGGYAFAGKTVKLNRRDYDLWKARFSALPSFDTELRAIDDWLQDHPAKKWFYAVERMLARAAERETRQRRGPPRKINRVIAAKMLADAGLANSPTSERRAWLQTNNIDPDSLKG